DVGALALTVGTVVAALAGSFVPLQAQPAQAVVDDVEELLAVALLVGVLDAQDERAAGVAGVEPVEQRGAGAADVKEPGGAGGETDANVGHGEKRRLETRERAQHNPTRVRCQNHARSAGVSRAPEKRGLPAGV